MLSSLRAGYRRFDDAHERMLRPLNSFFKHLEDFLIIGVCLALTLAAAGFSLAYWLGVTAVAWKFLLN